MCVLLLLFNFACPSVVMISPRPQRATVSKPLGRVILALSPPPPVRSWSGVALPLERVLRRALAREEEGRPWRSPVRPLFRLPALRPLRRSARLALSPLENLLLTPSLEAARHRAAPVVRSHPASLALLGRRRLSPLVRCLRVLPRPAHGSTMRLLDLLEERPSLRSVPVALAPVPARPRALVAVSTLLGRAASGHLWARRLLALRHPGPLLLRRAARKALRLR